MDLGVIFVTGSHPAKGLLKGLKFRVVWSLVIVQRFEKPV
jgi:hypothetical protein